MKGLLARLQKKYAKLPLWAWASIAGGAGWYLLRRRGAAATVAADSSQLAPPVDAYGASDTSSGAGDLSGVGPVDNGTAPLDTAATQGAGEAFADRGVTSDFQDFMNQLYGQTLSSKAPPTDTAGAEAVSPTSTQTAKLAPKTATAGRARGRPRWVPGRGGEKGHWAYKNGSWAPAPPGAKPPATKVAGPKRGSVKPPRSNRSGTRVGAGRAGARARPPAAKPRPPAPPKARPRGIEKKTAAAPRPKPRPRPRGLALPGMRAPR